MAFGCGGTGAGRGEGYRRAAVLKAASAMVAISVLDLFCIAGLIGMYILDGGWALCFFLMAALPLLIGALVLWREISAGR